MDTSTIAISTMNPRAIQTCRCEFSVFPSRGRYRSTTLDELRAASALSKLDMAAANRTVEIRGPRGSAATLDAGLLITGWKLSSTIAGVWEAPIPAGSESRQLWVDDRRAPRVHSSPVGCSGGPVDSTLECDKTIIGGNITATGYSAVPDPQVHISSTSLTKWLAGAEFVYGRGTTGASWTEPRCTVTSVSAGSTPGLVDIVMAQPCWAHAFSKGQGQGPHKGPSDIENSLEFFRSDSLSKSTAGEWFGGGTRVRAGSGGALSPFLPAVYIRLVPVS